MELGKFKSRPDQLEIIISVLVCGTVAAGIGVGLRDSSGFLSWTREDGPIEWLTVLGLLLCAGLCFLRMMERERRPASFRWLAALFGAAFLFGAGEEISWGQRLLGLETPEWMARHSRQPEINLHNLVVLGVDLTKLVFGKLLVLAFTTYLMLLPVLYLRNQGFGRFIDRHGLPVARPRQALMYLVLAIAIHLPDIPGRESELFEFAVVFITFLVFLNPLNRAAFDRHSC